MSLELVRENVTLTHVLDEQISQITIEDDIIVPDIKPDIEEILQTNGKFYLSEKEIAGDKLKFKGNMKITILYLAQDGENPVQSLEGNFLVDDYMNMNELTKDSMIHFTCSIEDIKVEMLNGRKVHIRIIMEVKAKADVWEDKELVTDVLGGKNMQVQKETCEIRQFVTDQVERIIVKDEIAVPSGKPNIHEILWNSISVKNKEVKLLDDKIIVKGDLGLSLIYIGEYDEKPVELMESEIPFNGIIECSGCSPDMFSDVDMEISNQYIQVKPDLDGEDRLFEIEVVAEINIQLYTESKIEMVNDIQEPFKRAHMEKEEVPYQKTICKNQAQVVTKENITIDDNYPDVMQIYSAVAVPKIDDIIVGDNEVEVEGVIFLNLLYVAADDDKPLYSYKEVIPFHQIVDTPGSNYQCTAKVKPMMEYVACNMISNKELEVKCTMTLDVNVLEEKIMDIISQIDLEEFPIEDIEAFPSVIIYVIQNGDTLWKIAKKFNTTIDALVEINGIQDPDCIIAGDKLIILKRVIEFDAS